MDEFAHPFFVVVFMLFFSFTVFAFTLNLQRRLSRHLARKDSENLKLSTYDCGPVPNKQPNRIAPHYFILGLLFILFDVEIIFMVPWAVCFDVLGIFGFVEMIMFIGLLAIGFIYAWKKGALTWQNIK